MINPTEEMIIIKGEMKTSSVQSCFYNRDTLLCDVTFSNGKKYSYAYGNVEILRSPDYINLNEYILQGIESPIPGNIKGIYAFCGYDGTYYHVVLDNGHSKDYTDREVRLVRTAFKSKISKDLWEYFKRIAEINDLRDDSGERILKKQFEKIGFISEDNALSPYLNAESPRNNRVLIPPIFPFGCNNSQYKAVENAINNQLSVIQGPPGTGKTQTILNIIANILIRGKTVQVVSNNNSAIENVLEKLASPKYNLGFIVAMLGKGENKRQFVDNQRTTYPDFSLWRYWGDLSGFQYEIQSLSQKLKVVYSDEEQIAKLTNEKSVIEVEKAHFEQYLIETGTTLETVRIKKNAGSADLMRLWQILLEKSEKGISFWQKLLLFFKLGLRDKRVFNQNPVQIIPSLQAMFYEKRSEEIDKEIDALKTDIAKMHVNTDELAEKSMLYLKHKLAERYSGKIRRKAFTEDDFWRNPQEVLKEYPVTFSTTYASKSSLGSKANPAQYDYVIIDEASQVDIATGVLALSSSKNAIIVGDTKQLPNVVTDEDRETAEKIFSQYKLPEGYKYTKSFLQSVLDIIPGIPTTLLREHYRCHPKIINYCNQKFYAGELVIMTHDNGEENVIKAFTTAAGNHARNRYNQRQIDVIKQEILPELGGDLSGIGIISPYRNQVEAIREEIPGIEVNTVHKFQGREKDTIIISTVDDKKNDFSDNPYLINVAVSRAKKRLYIVASGNELEDGNITDLISYIRYNNCEVVESKVYSIFDYLYSCYSDARKQYLQGKKRVSEYDSENLMFDLLQRIIEECRRTDIGIITHLPLSQLLRDTSIMTDEEKTYAMNPYTHIDFTLYNRISKKDLAAIEVDGFKYHKKGTPQAERDLLKNSIMQKYDIPLLRFSTNGSGEEERLRSFISGLS